MATCICSSAGRAGPRRATEPPTTRGVSGTSNFDEHCNQAPVWRWRGAISTKWVVPFCENGRHSCGDQQAVALMSCAETPEGCIAQHGITEDYRAEPRRATQAIDGLADRLRQMHVGRPRQCAEATVHSRRLEPRGLCEAAALRGGCTINASEAPILCLPSDRQKDAPIAKNERLRKHYMCM